MDIREHILKLRRQLTKSERYDASRLITQSVIAHPDWQRARNVCLYVSLPEEVDTSLLARAALGERKIVCVPRVTEAKKLALFQIHTFDDLAPGHFGIYEPKAYCKKIPARSVELFIVPGVAFDPQGNRLGWGAGYYDALLKTLPTHTIGLAYACQIVPRLHRKKYDIPMDTVITEKGGLR